MKDHDVFPMRISRLFDITITSANKEVVDLSEELLGLEVGLHKGNKILLEPHKTYRAYPGGSLTVSSKGFLYAKVDRTFTEKGIICQPFYEAEYSTISGLYEVSSGCLLVNCLDCNVTFSPNAVLYNLEIHYL